MGKRFWKILWGSLWPSPTAAEQIRNELNRRCRAHWISDGGGVDNAPGGPWWEIETGDGILMFVALREAKFLAATSPQYVNRGECVELTLSTLRGLLGPKGTARMVPDESSGRR